jgi:glycosyltransferase involved in cell wall biosynthesis
MPEIALGTKIFNRVTKLESLFDSLSDTPIDTVYVADDGEPSEDKKKLYGANYEFDLNVLDMEYDAGLGHGRNQIVEACDEPYLLIVDSDHQASPGIARLAKQLEARPKLGGVSGLLLERQKIRGVCHDLFQKKNVLIRDVREDKIVQRVAGDPLIEFDFIPNTCMFRREALEDQMWDPEYIIGKEHIDFYWTHKQKTDWTFGVNPTVLFAHHPGGDSKYVTNRNSVEKLTNSKRYFLKKWNLQAIVLGETDWTDGTQFYRKSGYLAKQALKSGLLSLPAEIQAPLMQLRDKVRQRRNYPPI